MAEERDDTQPDAAEEAHPRGTLAVVLIYMGLFVFGWLALYLVEFLPRGAPGP